MSRNNTSWLNILLALLTCGSAWCQAQQTALEPPHSMFRVPIARGALVREVPPSQNTQPPAVTFTFGTIDYPNGPQTVAQSVNKKGEIVGSWGPDINLFQQGLPAYGFVLKGTSFKKIVYPGAPITVPYGVNSAGEIVGFYSLDPLDKSGHGFTLVGTTFASIDYPGAQYTLPFAINKGGQILTIACFSGVSFCQSYLLKSGVFSAQVLYPGSVNSIAYGINDAGEIVGTYSNDGVIAHGFTLISSTFTTVDYPGATNTYLTGLNNSGQIVGAWDNGGVDKYGNLLSHGFLFESGTFTSFDSPYAVASTLPWGINDMGVIVGQTIDANGFFLGFEATIGK